jgi:hypothetical protein
MNIELTFTTLILNGFFFIFYLASGIFSILLCKKYSISEIYFTKTNIARYLFVAFFLIYFLIPRTELVKSKLAMPLVAMGYILVFSMLGKLFYNRFKFSEFFNTEFYQCTTGVIIFTILNAIRVYFQIFFK